MSKEGIKAALDLEHKGSDPQNLQWKMLVQNCYSLITILLEGYLGLSCSKHPITDDTRERLISPSCSWMELNSLRCIAHTNFLHSRLRVREATRTSWEQTLGINILLTLKTPTFNTPQVCHVILIFRFLCTMHKMSQQFPGFHVQNILCMVNFTYATNHGPKEPLSAHNQASA